VRVPMPPLPGTCYDNDETGVCDRACSRWRVEPPPAPLGVHSVPSTTTSDACSRVAPHAVIGGNKQRAAGCTKMAMALSGYIGESHGTRLAPGFGCILDRYEKHVLIGSDSCTPQLLKLSPSHPLTHSATT
jgi:hypothetical protein